MALTENDVQNITGIMSGKEPVQPVEAPATTAQEASSTPTPEVETPGQQVIPEQPGPPPAEGEQKPTESEIEEIQLEQLGFDSMDQLYERLNRIQELEAENNRLSVYKDGPQFKSERHKLLYDLGTKVEGMELEAARQLLNVVALDLTKLSDQQIRFEAFRMKPENKGYAQDELLTLFKEEDLNRFGNPDDIDDPQTESQKIRLRQATSLAKEELSKLQTNWNQARAAEITPAEIVADQQAYRQFLFEQTSGFDGIQFALAAQDEGGEEQEGAFNFKLDPQKQLPEIIEALANPNSFWDQLLQEEGVYAPGQQQVPDYNKWAALVTFIKHRYEITNNIYQQGREDERAHRLKKARNVADPSSTVMTPGGEIPKKTERQQMVEAAMKTVGQL